MRDRLRSVGLRHHPCANYRIRSHLRSIGEQNESSTKTPNFSSRKKCCLIPQSGSFLAIWTPAVTDVAGSNGSPFMVLMIAKGASAIVGPMIGAALHPKHSVDGRDAGCSYNGGLATNLMHHWGPCGFRTSIIFVGATMAGATFISGVTILLRRRRSKLE